MAVRQFGGTVYLEPDAVVTYIGPRPLAATDTPMARAEQYAVGLITLATPSARLQREPAASPS